MTRRVELGGGLQEVELCTRCWDELRDPFLSIAPKLRRVKLPKPPRAQVLKLGTIVASEQGGWTWTQHALDRLAERGLDAAAVLRAAADPQVIRPGELPELKVHERDGVKAVVVPGRKVIVTCALVEPLAQVTDIAAASAPAQRRRRARAS